MLDLISESGEFEAILAMVTRVAPTQATVLITGESGTGKERIARLLHELSPRKAAPFVAVNCSAFPETLLESELFGYERGAFTGADRERHGLLETAHGGTLFLDEVGDMSLPIQVKLLRFIQDRRILRIGGRQEIQLDVRIVAATHQNLLTRITEKLFREDLYYRIHVVSIEIPPLRHRRSDIRPLVNHFLTEFARKNRKAVRGCTAEVWQTLLRYQWPGNVRELENAIETAVVLATGPLIQLQDLPIQSAVATTHSSPPAKPPAAMPTELAEELTIDPGTPLERWVEQLKVAGNFTDIITSIEQHLVNRALRECGGNRSAAARWLGLSEKNIRDRLQKWGAKGS